MDVKRSQVIVVQKLSYCGPECECQGCANLPVEQHADEKESADEDNGDSSGLASDSSEESSDNGNHHRRVPFYCPQHYLNL